MPTAIVLNPQDSYTPERTVREIHVGVGTVVITPPDGKPVVATADESYDAEGRAAVAIYSAEGARVLLTYMDEPADVEVGGPRPTTASNLNSPQKTSEGRKPAKKARKKK